MCNASAPPGKGYGSRTDTLGPNGVPRPTPSAYDLASSKPGGEVNYNGPPKPETNTNPSWQQFMGGGPGGSANPNYATILDQRARDYEAQNGPAAWTPAEQNFFHPGASTPPPAAPINTPTPVADPTLPFVPHLGGPTTRPITGPVIDPGATTSPVTPGHGTTTTLDPGAITNTTKGGGLAPTPYVAGPGGTDSAAYAGAPSAGAYAPALPAQTFTPKPYTMTPLPQQVGGRVGNPGVYGGTTSDLVTNALMKNYRRGYL